MIIIIIKYKLQNIIFFSNLIKINIDKIIKDMQKYKADCCFLHFYQDTDAGFSVFFPHNKYSA